MTAHDDYMDPQSYGKRSDDKPQVEPIMDEEITAHSKPIRSLAGEAIDLTISLLRETARRHPQILQDTDIEAFILNELRPAKVMADKDRTSCSGLMGLLAKERAKATRSADLCSDSKKLAYDTARSYFDPQAKWIDGAAAQEQCRLAIVAALAARSHEREPVQALRLAMVEIRDLMLNAYGNSSFHPRVRKMADDAIAAFDRANPSASVTIKADAGPDPDRYATYLVNGKPHRTCGCDPYKGPCAKGLERKLLTCELSRCLVPDDRVMVTTESTAKRGYNTDEPPYPTSGNRSL